MKKVRSNVKVLVLTGVISVAVAGFGNKYMTNAGQYLNASENNIVLNVEKQDRDTVKIYLSNVYDLAKSIQLSVKIDDGNVTFNDSEIKWLVNADSKNTQKQYKINDKKNEIEFFIVSDEVINSEDGIVEICEIDVSKNESILNNLINSNNGSYRVVPNYDDKDAYSYVTYATNKRVGGNNIINASEDKLTINTDPVIKFRDVSSVINDKIIISKGTVFNVNDYVVAYDADGNEIPENNVTYSGNIDNKKPGSYNIECKATDSYGDSSILKATVIVEEETAGNVAMPVISGTDVPIEIIVGENFDLEKGITATDYRGRTLEVKISGDYDVSNPGTYTLTYSATDRFNNTVTATRTLIVKEKPSDPAPVLPPDNNTGNGSGSTTPGNGGSDSTPDNKYDIPGELVDIINNNIIPESGDGSVDSPLVVTASKDIDRAGFGVFIGQLSDKFKIKEAVIEDDSTYRTLKLTMSKKSSKYNLFNLFNSVKNSDEIYLHIKVDNSRSDLFDIMDSLKSHVDSSNSNGSGSNSSTGGSGSNGSTGGSGSNDSTGGSGSNGSTGGSGSNGSSGGSGSNGSSGGSGSNGSSGGSGSNGSTGGSGSNGSTGGSGSNGSTGGSGSNGSTG
ncbi:MAG: immunoglobulin-like domain-containing protein, partial [Clostridium sp.]